MKIVQFIFVTLLSIVCVSCFHEDEFENSRKGNFDAAWKIMDEHYCFFQYKDIDWQEVYNRYSQRITEDMTRDALFDIIAEMLTEVKDGHVNLLAPHNVSRYSKWYDDYPDNFYEHIQRNYIGTDYSMASGLKYKILENNIGYIYYGSFSSGLGSGNLDEVLSRMALCKGIIIDVRNNGGGMASNADKFAERFFTEKTLVGYMIHKTGKGHNDFSKPYERYIDPPANRIGYLKNVVVLTNRRSFSATNDFVNAMSYAPNTTIIGDRTGGGSGLPFSSEIPIGWSLRFAASPMLNASKEQIEFGIEPDIKVDISNDDMHKGKDTIIETAMSFIEDQTIINE